VAFGRSHGHCLPYHNLWCMCDAGNLITFWLNIGISAVTPLWILDTEFLSHGISDRVLKQYSDLAGGSVSLVLLGLTCTDL
jgi:hypothetical protein